jgi:hypothetical protein
MRLSSQGLVGGDVDVPDRNDNHFEIHVRRGLIRQVAGRRPPQLGWTSKDRSHEEAEADDNASGP